MDILQIGLLKGEDCEFNTGVKENSDKKNSARKYFLKEAPKVTQEPARAWKGKATAEPAKGPAKKLKRPFSRKSEEQKQVLRTENKCFICEQPGHFAPTCPQRKRPADSEDKEDRKGKSPVAGLVPDMVGFKPNLDASELCGAWGKVRDQIVLIFFDPGAKANFISPELASKLGIRSEEMGYTTEAGLACPGHTEAVTPIIGKLRLHIQSYVDVEEFYIMPLDGCDVLLGIPWLFRVQGIMDAYNKKITVQSRGKTLIQDIKLKGESIPTVSASAITSVMKKHLSAYLVFAREVSDCDESNLSVLDKERSMFLQQYSDCFSDSSPSQLPLERPNEDHAIDLVPGRHRGIDATVKAVETFFYWPVLRRDVDAFVQECIVCQKVKFDRQKAPGLLQPLPIPDKPWETIAMDFIFDLSRMQTGNDGIWTIICRFSKQAHFIPVRKKIKPDQMARLFMSNIFKYHGMPQSIVSDRDPRMRNGQSEEANSTVLDLLKCYVSEHKGKWEQYLPLVEYAYNNTVHLSTSKAPFEIVEGGKKVPPILHTKDKIFETDKYVQDMDEMYKKVKVALEKTQAKQKKAADRHRREVVFSLGDWVLLRFEKARLKKMKGKERLFPKLSMRYYGPFQVCNKISDVAYRLKFPESWRIHNAFHVSLLRPYVGDVPEDLPVEDQPEVEELDEILVPEQILTHKERKVKGKVARRYLVKFKNYPPMDAKWMEEGELAESPTVLSLYLEAFGLQPTLTP
ncbi:hypothetical protein L7F22_031970 [Adiantum nelumboides]|nr:hypothetical protein [Adiantum nelumboides]